MAEWAGQTAAAMHLIVRNGMNGESIPLDSTSSFGF